MGDGAVRDVHGGWFDASGDTSKYLSHLSYANFMNPQQTPLVVWVLARAWELYRAAGAPAYFLERIQAEALHGADWLVRMQDPAGFWHVTVFDKWTKDPAQRELCSYRTQKGDKYADYQAGWRQGGGMATAALAVASTLGDGADYRAQDYLDAQRAVSCTCRRTAGVTSTTAGKISSTTPARCSRRPKSGCWRPRRRSPPSWPSALRVCSRAGARARWSVAHRRCRGRTLLLSRQRRRSPARGVAATRGASPGSRASACGARARCGAGFVRRLRSEPGATIRSVIRRIG